jgi:DNA-binding transcriptional MerR regulator
MKIFNLKPSRKDQELTRLQKELLEKDITLKAVRAYNDELLHEKVAHSVRSKDREAILEEQVRSLAEKTRKLEEQNASSREEQEVYRAAFNAVASGSDQFPNPALMLELARQATKIVRDSQRSCSLSYELYAVQLCNAADRVIPGLNEKEAKFFVALLGSDYTPPHERGSDWQTEYEIRWELYREMYREEELSEQRKPERDHGLENQQEGTALEIAL